MRFSPSCCFKTLLLCSYFSLAHAQTIELEAISDFTNLNSGEVPYYLDIAGDRKALAINAAVPNFRNKFARAEHEFLGADGVYDITINAMGEIDGEGTYRLSVNGVVMGVAVNPPVSTDYTIVKHKFSGITLVSPTVIAVESTAVSNDTVPEGDGFAFARGRWAGLSIETPDPTAVNTVATANIGVSLSTVNALLNVGNEVPFIVTALNGSSDTVATNLLIEIELPSGIEFISSDICTRLTSGVRCVLSELPPGESQNLTFTGLIQTSGWANVSAAISADQIDEDRNNNTANLSFEVPATPANETDTSSNGDTGLDNQGTTDAGSTDVNNQGTSGPGSSDSSGNTSTPGTVSGTSDTGALGLFFIGMLFLMRRVRMHCA